MMSSCGHLKKVDEPNFYVSRRYGRKDYQLIYVVRGMGTFDLPDQRLELHEGNILIYLPKQPQYYIYNQIHNPEVYWVHFTGSQVEKILTEFNLLPRQVHKIGISAEICMLFDKMIEETHLKRPSFIALTNALLMHLLVMMSRSAAGSDSSAQSCIKEIEQAILMFHQNYQKRISIQEYARKCGISPAWFTRCFNQRTGVSPQQYLTDIRIKRSMELLLSTSHNITEVASQSGYDNPFYFSRIFKNNIGCTPSEFRQKSINSG